MSGQWVASLLDICIVLLLCLLSEELTIVDQRKTGATNKPTEILCYTTVLEHFIVTTIAINITTITITNINKITINTSSLIY